MNHFEHLFEESDGFVIVFSVLEDEYEDIKNLLAFIDLFVDIRNYPIIVAANKVLLFL